MRVVDVVADTRIHVAAKEIPDEIAKKVGAQKIDGIVAIERKLVLEHTKGFHELPREKAFSLIDDLRETLMMYANDASEGPLAALEYGEDAETVRDELRDAQKWAKELWQEVLKKFRSVDLSMAVVDFWECQRDQAQWAAEKAFARALAKIRQAPDSEGGDGNSQ